jgi:succinate dehydrogenase / fumarate reductase flavoprotein subunit
VIPYTLANFFANAKKEVLPADSSEFKRCEEEVTKSIQRLLSIKGKRTAVEIHRDLGKVMWDNVGMARTRQSLESAIGQIRNLREEFWNNVTVPGSGADLNQSLERAGRVADHLEFGELLARDALTREESCGGHFREEYQDQGETKRDDENFSHVAAWEYRGHGVDPVRNVEPLTWEVVQPSIRSYK